MPDACQLDDLRIDLQRRRVYRGDEEIPLSALSFDTLRVLIEATPEPVSTDELIEHAWNGAVVSDETVTQRIRLLRRALGDDPRHPRYIDTHRGAGYRLVPPVESVTETPARKRAPIRTAIGLAALVVLGLLAWIGTVSPPESVEPDAPVAELNTGPLTAEELSAQGRELMAQRNPVSLANAIELFERAVALDPDAAEPKANLALSLALSVAWYSAPPERLERAERLAREVRAMGSWFEGEYALALSLDARGRLEGARAAYERAVALRPDHWGARASLAYLLQVRGRLVEALAQNLEAMKAGGEGKLDVQVATCLRLLGFHAVASRWLARADQLHPGSPHAAPSRALDLITRGEVARAREEIGRAIERGVQQVELYEYLAVLALRDGDPDAARAALDSAPEAISHHGAFEVWRRILDAGTDRAAAVEHAAHIRAAIAAGDTWPENHLYVAMLESAAGREAQAIQAIERLADAGYRDHLWLEVLPPFDAIRDRPGFVAVLEEMRNDVARQRAQVLSASWLPDELRETDLTLAPPEE